MTDLNAQMEELNRQKDIVQNEINKSNDNYYKNKWAKEEDTLKDLLEQIKPLFTKSYVSFADDGDYKDYFEWKLHIEDSTREYSGEITIGKDGTYDMEIGGSMKFDLIMKLLTSFNDIINTDTK